MGEGWITTVFSDPRSNTFNIPAYLFLFEGRLIVCHTVASQLFWKTPCWMRAEVNSSFDHGGDMGNASTDAHVDVKEVEGSGRLVNDN